MNVQNNGMAGVMDQGDNNMKSGYRSNSFGNIMPLTATAADTQNYF
jgi:hypothetical protein